MKGVVNFYVITGNINNRGGSLLTNIYL